MAQFPPEKFLDFVENFDSKNTKQKAAMLEFAQKVSEKQPELMSDEANWVKTYRSPLIPVDRNKVIEKYSTILKVSNFSQPDGHTCQSACIAMAVNDANIYGIRRKLEATGLIAGDPSAMARVIKTYTSKYKFEGNASLNQVYDWLEAGEFLITHGWFTNSGHVICLDGLELDTKTLSHKISVKDPWSEFFAKSWSYSNKNIRFYDGYYSSQCIYASCVAGSSAQNARSIFNRGELNSARQGMWVHRFLTK
jgi:hypothetical protein